ncbi:MAG: Sec-independent protein translocase subunit TatB [Propionibacteriaceae bacterium]|nr:Sec-independent protein translocase subunit TatB [Propionibacteriaceae bacterium]
MIDFNMSEILVLGVLAVIIFGPEKLPELARKAARVISYLRNIANDAQGRLRQELGPEFADLELADLNPRALVNKHLLNPVQAEATALKSHPDAPSRPAGSPVAAAALPAAADRSDAGPGALPAAAPTVVAFDTEAT